MDFLPQLKRLNEEAWFKRFLEDELAAKAPKVPAWNPRDDNTDLWKYDSALREGYLMCLRNMGIELTE